MAYLLYRSTKKKKKTVVDQEWHSRIFKWGKGKSSVRDCRDVIDKSLWEKLWGSSDSENTINLQSGRNHKRSEKLKVYELENH